MTASTGLWFSGLQQEAKELPTCCAEPLAWQKDSEEGPNHNLFLPLLLLLLWLSRVFCSL